MNFKSSSARRKFAIRLCSCWWNYERDEVWTKLWWRPAPCYKSTVARYKQHQKQYETNMFIHINVETAISNVEARWNVISTDQRGARHNCTTCKRVCIQGCTNSNSIVLIYLEHDREFNSLKLSLLLHWHSDRSPRLKWTWEKQHKQNQHHRQYHHQHQHHESDH
jgi:hypothetical protein